MTKTWVRVFLSLASGIVLGFYEAWYGVVMAVVVAGFCVVWRKIPEKNLLYLAVLLVGTLLCVFAVDVPMQKDMVDQGVSLQGKVSSYPSQQKDKTTFVVSTEHKSRVLKKMRVTCYGPLSVTKGDTIEIKGRLKTPRRPGNPGEFDYPAFLRQQGIYYLLTVKHPTDIKVIGHQQGPLEALASFRSRGEKLVTKVLSSRESAILLGMLLGSRGEIDPEQYDDFQKVGIVHLFSVSGLHVGFLLLLITWVCSLLGASPRGKFYAGVFLLFLYGTMVGWPVSIIRAVLMASLGLLAYYSGREKSVLNAMAIAGIIILLINPLSLFEISFQLSFMATWGLIYLFPTLREHLPIKGKTIDMILLPVCAELAVMPLVAYHFNLFCPVSIISNIMVSYLAGGSVILGFIAFFFAPLASGLASLFLYPAGFFIELIMIIVDGLKGVPGAYCYVATPGIWLILLYYIALFILLAGLKKASRFRGGLGASVMLVFIIILLLPAGIFDRGKLEAIFLDVGQGDAILMKTPGGKFILIDGGGSAFYDVGYTVVLPYLHHRGIRKLDLVINTHPDTDHLGGLETVVSEIKVQYIGIPASLQDAKEYKILLDTANQKKIPVKLLSRGQEVALEEDLRIEVLHPGTEDRYVKENANNDSVVLRMIYHHFSILLTGDIEAEGMQTLLAQNQMGPISVVKVPHHGSKYSNHASFYQHLKPYYAIISVGASNTFGHPHQEIIDMLEDNQIQVLRTDRAGAVIIESNGKKMSVKGTI